MVTLVDDERAGTTAFSEVWEIAEEECADKYAEGTFRSFLSLLPFLRPPSSILNPSQSIRSLNETRRWIKANACITGKEIL
jgi:hypothetical protein